MTCACCQEREAVELGLCAKCGDHEILRRHFAEGTARQNGWEPMRAFDDLGEAPE